MPARRPPSVRARQLAGELRRVREVAELTGEEAAARLGWSASKISRVETGRTAINAGDLQVLLNLYQITGSRRDWLVELGRSAGQRGWWDAYSDNLRSGYSTFLALEDEVESERYYATTLVPGLLQTEDYAEDTIRAGLLFAPPGEVRRRVEVRMTRQSMLLQGNSIELTVILDEAILRRRVGGVSVMTEQLAHLTEMAIRPNVNIQVLPFATGSHPAMSGGFAILRFPEVIATDVVFLASMTSEVFVENETEVYRYSLAFDRLREIALEEQESIALINRIANEMN